MKYNLLITAVFLSSFSVFSQVLDLATCLKMADTANTNIRNARLDIDVNAIQKKVYLASRLPKLTATGDYRYNAIIAGQVVPAEFFGGPPGTYSTVKFGVPYNLSNSIQLTQILYNPQLNYGFAALDINQKIVAAQERLMQQDIKQQVSSTYFNLQAIVKQLEFVESNIANLTKLIANLQKSYELGLVIETEVDKLKISRLTLLNTKLSTEATKTQLSSLLKILIGINSDGELSLVSDEMMENTILVDQNNINHPELELMAAQKEMNAEERKGTKMAYLPSVSFYASYNYAYNIKPKDDFRTGINSAFLGLHLDWTLFDGFEKYNKQKMNALNKDKLENQEALLTKQLALLSETAKNQIDVQASSLETAKEQLGLANKVYVQTQAQFTAGTISSNELIQADNGLQQAQTNVVAAYIQLRQAELAYLRSIGSIK
ncbi:MAG: TolC family protein [Flavobacteriia bacterium]|nr:TolC family protein [Flavobacteriia bacterium]